VAPTTCCSTDGKLAGFAAGGVAAGIRAHHRLGPRWGIGVNGRNRVPEGSGSTLGRSADVDARASAGGGTFRPAIPLGPLDWAAGHASAYPDGVVIEARQPATNAAADPLRIREIPCRPW